MFRTTARVYGFFAAVMAVGFGTAAALAFTQSANYGDEWRKAADLITRPEVPESREVSLDSTLQARTELLSRLYFGLFLGAASATLWCLVALWLCVKHRLLGLGPAMVRTAAPTFLVSALMMAWWFL